VQNFAFKFQAVAEKTAKNVREGATLFCRTLYSITNYDIMNIKLLMHHKNNVKQK